MHDPVHKKLDEIHQDVKGGFHSLHDRMDRENTDRAYGFERIAQMWATVMAKIDSLFRRTP
jgi:hypothetical protein